MIFRSLFLLYLLFCLINNSLAKEYKSSKDSILWHESDFNQIWDSLLIDFEYKDFGNQHFKIFLNYKNSELYYFVEMVKIDGSFGIQLGQRYNGLNRIIERFNFNKGELSGGSYSFRIYSAPMVDKEHWKSWKLELIARKDQIRIAKFPMENNMPLFGFGKVGVLKFENISNMHIKSFHSRNDLKSRSLLPDLFFASGMIIPQNKPFNIWGKALPMKRIEIKLANKKAFGYSDAEGNWEILFPAIKKGSGFGMEISDGSEFIRFDDISVGEIWLASGQSNMEMRAWQSDVVENKEFLNDILPIKFYIQKQYGSKFPLSSSLGEWISIDDERIWGVSAVALSFAINLYKETKVPIAIVQSAWGGTAVQSWMSHATLSQDSIGRQGLDRAKKYQSILDSGIDVSVNGPYFRDIPDYHHQPSALYNAMINPLIKIPIQGFLWYQGESNTARASTYFNLFTSFVNGLRQAWDNPKLPIIAVQLAGYDGRLSGNEHVGAWPLLRESQRRVLKEDKYGVLVNAFDLGDSLDIHPYKKWELGKRMSYAAQDLVYNKRNSLYVGPLIKNIVYAGKVAILIYHKETVNFKKIKEEISGFEVAADNKVYYPAEVKILSENRLVVTASQVQNIKEVRYGWENYPVKSNLKNENLLPAMPFATDNWTFIDVFPDY